MNDKYVELEYLGGHSSFSGSHLIFKKGDSPNTIFIENQLFQVNKFKWIEKETQNLGLAAIGFLIGFILGAAAGQDPAIGLGGGIIGAVLLGWRKDTSIIIFSLSNGETEVCLYSRCSKEQFKEISEFL